MVTARLAKSWSQVVAGASWAPTFHLGTSNLRGSRLLEVWPEAHLQTLDWQDWARAVGPGVDLRVSPVEVNTTSQVLAAAFTVATVDDAARIAGIAWTQRLARARERVTELADRFADLTDPAAVLRRTDDWTDVDFDLACRAATWFATNPESGLTARQVPVAGMGTKWLDEHGAVVRMLADVASLGLTSGRPSRVHITYLDPVHLDGGGRRHDVVTVGDANAVAYQPRIVIISENRDTAQLFPEVPGGIAIEGDGNGPGAVPGLAWVQNAEICWYWGDMDTAGLEILHGFRAAGVRARSLFMDMDAYRRWERFGVDRDHVGNALTWKAAREVLLGASDQAERELYLALCSEDWRGHRRIEQERIPLVEAHAVVMGDLRRRFG